MNHEHFPGCGHEAMPQHIHDHHEHHDHRSHLTLNLGVMCCAGQCSHQEHQISQALVEQERLLRKVLEDDDDDEEEDESTPRFAKLRLAA